MKNRVASTSAASRERLEKISHHFLTAAEPRRRQEAVSPLTIPIISVSPEAAFPHDRLARALASRGRPARVLEISRELQNSAHPASLPDPTHQPGAALSLTGKGGTAPATPDGVRDAIGALNPAPAFCLVPLKASEVVTGVELGCLLIGAEPNREGLLAAYRLAKAAWAHRPGASVGVTILNARDRTSAALHFKKLAEAVTRFLGEELVSFGFIPEPPDPYAAVDLLSDERQDTGVNRAVEGIANLILADLEAMEAEAEAAQVEAEAPLRALRAAGNA